MRKKVRIKSKIKLDQLVDIFKDEPYFFMLDSSRKKDVQSNYTFIGFDPISHLEIDELGENALGELNNFYLNNLNPLLKNDMKDDGKFSTGFFCFMTYDLGISLLGVRSRFPHEGSMPFAFIGYYPVIIEIDHKTDKLHINYEEEYKDKFFKIARKIQELKAENKQTENLSRFFLTYKEDYQNYFNKICKIKDYIYEGDVYQINYTRQFQGKISNLDATKLYFNLREKNPAPFSAYIKNDGWAILSSSPERLIKSVDNKLETRPIKGTIEVSKNCFQNKKNKKILLTSEKDKSELLMIVDLERNDLSKVSISGTVKVEDLYKLETYETVHHLVSTITSVKSEDTTPFDVMAGVFPGGSITGTPKKRAVEIIDELEEQPRGIYTGSIGYIDQNGNFDFNIAIRTIILEKNKAFFNVGGGITWKSNPLDEFNETEHKGLGLKRGLGFEG